jgi:hypothetical protein
MRYVPNPHVEGDVYILVKNVSAVRLASEVRTPVSARLFDYEVYNPESAITACATYVLEPGYVYLYEGGVSLRAVQLSWFIHNCTIYSQRTYRPTDSDLQANDKDWNDARSLLAKFTIDAITIDALIKNAPKELIEIVNWGSLLELMAAGAIDVSVLEEVLKNTLKVSDLASRSHYATQMVNQFIDGSGDAPPYEPFSDLSQAVASNSVFDVTVESALKDLDSKVAALNLASGGKLDCNALQLPNRPLPFFPKSDLPIGWPVGGTQGLEIKVQRLWADPYHNMYSATIDFTIFDVFGVGDDDVYAPPLIAFWLLQHIKEFEGRHKPFINEIIVRIDINNRQFWTMYEKG